MGQKERDRLKIVTEAKKGLIRQAQAARQLEMSERQVRRLLRKLRAVGDRALVHGLRGQASNRWIDTDIEKRAIEELSRPECHDFAPTFAAEHVSKLLGRHIGRDTVRKWMMEAGLWKSRKRQVEASINGANAGRALANWCSGIPPITTGSKAAASVCI